MNDIRYHSLKIVFFMFQRLFLPFYVDFCNDLPAIVKFHDPSGLVWKGTYVKKCKSTTDLSGMMSFYGIKPYHIILMSYKGGSDFHFQVYNPYTVEIPYHMDTHACNLELACNSLEVDKLSSNFSYNAYGNFGGVYHLLIEPKHLLGCTFTEVTTLSF